MIDVVWEFRVKRGREGDFELHYAGGGTWERLFRRSPGYLGTVLLRDQREPRHYLLTDRWRDLDALESFRRDFSREYESLDRQCETLTEEERLVGCFPSPDAAP